MTIMVTRQTKHASVKGCVASGNHAIPNEPNVGTLSEVRGMETHLHDENALAHCSIAGKSSR